MGEEEISVLLRGCNECLIAPAARPARSGRDHPSRSLVSIFVSNYMEGYTIVPCCVRGDLDALEEAIDPWPGYGQGTVSAFWPQRNEARVLVQHMEPNKWLLQGCSEPWAVVASFRGTCK